MAVTADEAAQVWTVRVEDYEDSSAVEYRGYTLELLGLEGDRSWRVLSPDNGWMRGVNFTFLTEALRFVDGTGPVARSSTGKCRRHNAVHRGTYVEWCPDCGALRYNGGRWEHPKRAGAQ